MATDFPTNDGPYNLAKLIRSHLIGGVMSPGGQMGLRIDRTLTQDATGTLVMQELEALGLERVRTELSAQYVDHNLAQTEKNAQDHEFLLSACRRYGLWFSQPGNGVSHPTHMQRFGKPGVTHNQTQGVDVALRDLWNRCSPAPFRRSAAGRPTPAVISAVWSTGSPMRPAASAP